MLKIATYYVHHQACEKRKNEANRFKASTLKTRPVGALCFVTTLWVVGACPCPSESHGFERKRKLMSKLIGLLILTQVSNLY